MIALLVGLLTSYDSRIQKCGNLLKETLIPSDSSVKLCFEELTDIQPLPFPSIFGLRSTVVDWQDLV